MEPHEEFVYQFIGGDNGTIRVVVASVSDAHLDTRWVLLGGEVVMPVNFTRPSREIITSPFGFAFHWVGPGEILASTATMGRENTTYQGMTPEGHVFQSAIGRYVFHATEGFLLRAEHLPSGRSVNLVERGTASEIPVPRNDVIVQTGQMEGNSATLPLGCGGKMDSVLGGDDSCERPFTVSGSFQAVFQANFPYLGGGTTKLTLGDAHGTYATYTCFTLLYTTVSPPVCEEETHGPYTPELGENVFKVEGAFHLCLNPTTGFACVWSGQVLLNGGIAPA